MAGAPRELGAWLGEGARRWPAREALRAGAQRWSYAELAADVAAQAARLRAAGLGPGDRLGIAASRHPQTLIHILAAIEAGIGYVPFDLGYPDERLAMMAADSAPRAVVGEASALAELGRRLGMLPSLASPAAASSVFGAEPDLCYVLFTSGSTGRPKGVAMGREPLARLIDWHAAHPRLGQPARTLLFAPLSFDVHFQEIVATLAVGGCLVLTDEAARRDPARLVAVLHEQRIERLFLPYVALQMIADALDGAPPPPLRDLVSAGEQLQVTAAIRRLFAALPDAVLHNHYGPTESHVVTAFELAGDPADWPAIPPIGAPLPYVQAILRPLEDAPADEGELLLGGSTLAHGYLGRPELSAERFLADGQGRVYVTGDRVQRAPDGVLRYLGRCDRQLKIDGFRIEPGDVEVALLAVPGVRDAAVGAAELPAVGRQLVAWLVSADAADDALEARVRAALRESLPAYLQPARYVLLDRLPLTPSGKIDRAALRVPESAVEAAPAGSPGEVIAALWRALLGRPDLGERDNLFDAGARSLLVLRFIAQLKAAGIRDLGVADVYDAPSIAGLTARLASAGPAAASRPRRERAGGPIAIIGIALRSAVGSDTGTFWAQLLAGAEGIRHFRPDELDPALPDSLRRHPGFVAARGVIDDADRFDAEFFGVPTREAVLIDPQQRLLLELAWNALEDAGIRPDGDGRIGVYAGSANNSYITALRREAPQLIGPGGEFAAMLASEKDYVATRIAHKLDLTGPALSIHTACSTGLVAIAQACEALRAGQCELALAGGATVLVPQAGGYVHVEGGMESADGHCRPFDAAASGTVFASGAAMVVLKPLQAAQADGDPVYAVIHGVGLNNDGAQKASFTAPNVAGQAAAIRQALDDAGLPARAIGYVEAHGTATTLGDPIEVAALARAHQPDRGEPGSCVLGSLKGNLGHTIAAAGALGMVKCALALQHQRIPGTLHFTAPNPQIDFSATAFRVSAAALDWPRGETPRYAAVSSFGVGGTNAHLILGEAPAEAATPASGAPVLLPLSARTGEALLARARELAGWLEANPFVPLAAVQATLVAGRVPMAQRLAVAAGDRSQAVARLREVTRGETALDAPRLVFLLPGQGSQAAGMAASLHATLPAYAEALDAALAAVAPQLDIDLGDLLLRREDAEANTLLQQTRYAQPALFCHGYALARWLDALGLRPAALIGHSLGELVGACLAGILDLPAAARVVCTRGAAMWAQPRGAMLAVRQAAARLGEALPPGIEVAGYNAPELTVLAGPADAIDRLAGELGEAGVGHTRLHVSHAFHSAAMDGALEAVRAVVAEQAVAAPRLPLYSCVSGLPLSETDALDPDYWARQVRSPVRFADAVAAELRQPNTVFVEVGPGQALSALVRMQRAPDGSLPRVVALQAPAGQPATAIDALAAVGRLWALGGALDWPLPRGSARAHLPGYPFADSRFWFPRSATPVLADAVPSPLHPAPATAVAEENPVADRRPVIAAELTRLFAEVCGLAEAEIAGDVPLLELGLDSLSLTQASLELDRVFGIKLRFRRLMEDLDTVAKLAAHVDAELPAERFRPAAPAPQGAATPAANAAPATAALLPTAVPAFAAVAPILPAGAGAPLAQLIQQQMQLMQQQLALLAGQPLATPLVAPAPAPAPPPVAAPTVAVAASAAVAQRSAAPAEAQAPVDLREKPFGASARITLTRAEGTTPAQQAWIDDFTRRYLAKLGRSRAFAQQHRALMADPRVVTGFNPQWKDLVFPIVAERSDGARVWDIDGNAYIDLLSCFGANLLGYQPTSVVAAMHAQLDRGIEVGPSHPLAASVSQLISEFTGHPRVAFCNTGSEAVMGAMRVARTVTGRKTIAIFTNSYHGIFDEVIVRGTRQLRSLSAAPGILASAVENVLVLDYADEASLAVLRERGHELAAIMIEPVQNKYPTLQPRAFVHALREICDAHGCALIFDEVVTGFRLAPGGAQQFYGVRADLCTYGKIIGGGLPLAAIGGSARWLDALDGGYWQYGDDSYPEAGVTYFAGTFVRHPLALAAAQATLEHLKAGGQAYYDRLNARTQGLIDRLNAGFAARSAPCKAVHCASLWRLHWDDGQRNVSLFYYLARFHGLHLFEQFGHFVTEAMGEAEIARIAEVFFACLDELMALGLITRRDGLPPPGGGGGGSEADASEGPLSPGQGERWMAANFDQEALRALNESFSLSLRGALDAAALRAAIADVQQRHLAFRLAFDAESPTQRVALEQPQEATWHDLSTGPDPAAAARTFAEQAAATRFALTTAPLIRLAVLRLAADHHVLHLVASHLVFDGWAASVFLDELAQCYRARCAGRCAELPAAESPLQFARDEQARMAGPDGRASLEHWCTALRDPPPPLVLGDLPPPARRCFSADTVATRYDGALFTRLAELAKRQRVTLFQLLLANVAVVLRELAKQDDLVISLPYASQSLGRHPALLADGVLDLPLRLLCQGDDALVLLPQVRSRMMDALEFPLVTQGSLARALGVPPRGDRPPLTGVFFNLNPKLALKGFAPLDAGLREGRKPGMPGELMFNFYEEPDALALDLHHSSELFSLARIGEIERRLQAQLRRVVGLAAEPSAPPPAVAAAAPRRPRLATPLPPGPVPRAVDLVAAQIGATPQRDAVRFAGETLSYAALDQRSGAIAEALLAAGVAAGHRVGVSLRRSADLVAALYACWRIGAAYVPLDPAFPPGRLQHMVEDSGLGVIVCDEPARLAAELAGGRRVIDTRGLPPAPRAGLPALPADGDRPAYVLYTSGSTGKPKGVEVTQRNVGSFLAAMRIAPGIGADDRLLAVTTPSFDISVLELFLPLTVGACVVVASEDQAKNPGLIWPLLREARCSMLQTTPSVLQMWLTEAEPAALQGCTVLLGGEPLPAPLAASLVPACRALWNMYGPTETTIWSTCGQVTDPAAGIDIGLPIAGTTVYLLDAQLRPVADGVEAELCLGGPGVANGYVGRPDLTAERFVEVDGERIYRTGDLAKVDAGGRLRHLGRIDSQIKLRGYRIELGEIEAVLAEVPGVQRAVALVREDRPGDQRLVAYLTRSGSADPDLGLLQQRARHALPDYMVPQHVVLLDALPLLPNGKTDRKALPAPVTETAVGDGRAAATATERAVADAMASLLGLPTVAADRSFFQLGGHSLLAIQLTTRLNKQLGCTLKMRDVFELATAERLAALVEQQRSGSVAVTAQPAIPHLADPDRGPQSAMQRRLFQLAELAPGKNTYNMPSAHRLKGPLDVARLERALQALIARQPILRTRLVREAGVEVQQVLPAAAFRLPPIEDLSDLPPAQREAMARERMAAQIAQPIAVDAPPLFRARLYRLDADDHVLFFMTHHAIWDGWSFDVFYDEMAAFYGDPAAAAQRPPLPLQYTEFAAWHGEFLRSDAYRAQLDFWRNTLTGAGPFHALPGDFARSERMSGEAHSLMMDLPPALVARLHARAREHDATLFLVLLAAYAAMLQRCTGETALLLGTPVRGRNVPELEPLLGYFVNLVPLPLAVQPTQTLGELVRDVRQRSLGAFSNADALLEDLAGWLKVRTEGGSAPLYQASFSFQDVRQRPTRWGELAHSRFRISAPEVTEDLALFFVETGTALHAYLNYNSALFRSETVEGFHRTLMDLLEAFAADPQTRIDSVAPAVRRQRGAAAATAVAVSPVAATGSADAARDPESLLRGIWCELLGLESVQPEDNFFQLGGNSLLALNMVGQVERRCGYRLSLLRVGDSSLRALAAELASGAALPPSAAGDAAPAAARPRWWQRMLGRAAG